jgi:hypothetical protein
MMSSELENILVQAQKLDRQEQLQLISHLKQQTKSRSKQQSDNPWLATAGSLVDDPFFEDYVAAISEYRKSVG